MSALPSNRRVMNCPIAPPPTVVITRDEFAAICTRDGQCAETWFAGPASFTAMAARDRRVLLRALTHYAEACDELRLHLRELIEQDKRT